MAVSDRAGSVTGMGQAPRFVLAEPAYISRELDAGQRAVVNESGRKPLVVLGAPGTGKTTALIELVGAQLDAGEVTPESLVVLTPLRRAANRLREALAERVRRATPGPLARTPMSYALELATVAALARGEAPPRLLTGAEQDRIIAQLLEGAAGKWPESITPAMRESRPFRSELRDLLDRCIDRGIAPHELADLGRTHAVPEWIATATWWSADLIPVLDRLRFGFADVAEIAAQATMGVASGEAGTNVRLVVIDDAQEMTLGAINLVAAFASRGARIVLFGNPDQATTTFRGARPDFLGMAESYLGQPVTERTLHELHRADGEIHRALVAIEERIGTAATGSQRRENLGDSGANSMGTPSRVHVVRATQTAHELGAVARSLRLSHVRQGVPWHRMCVVVRQGSLVDSVARMLAAHEVPTRTLVSEQALRDRPLVREFVEVIRLATRPGIITSAEVEALLTSELGGLTSIDTRRLRLALRHAELAQGGNRTGPELLVASWSMPELLTLIDSPPAVAASRTINWVAAVGRLIENRATAEEVLWEIWNASPLPHRLVEESRGWGLEAEESNHRLDTVLALFAAARRFVEREPDRSVTEFVDNLMATDVPEDSLAPTSGAEAVLVCTPPATVGEEFDVVAVVAVQEGVWPNLRLRGQTLRTGDLDRVVGGEAPAPRDAQAVMAGKRAVLHDELRMFLASCSRARDLLIVSATEGEEAMASPFLNVIAPGDDASAEAGDQSTGAATVAEPPYPLTLTGVTGWLRRELAVQFDVGESTSQPKNPVRAELTAALIARLARAEVPGAHPNDWYGVLEPSSNRPLADAEDIASGALPHVSPSRLEAWERNQLGWFIDSTAGSEQTVRTGVGTLLHAAFEDAGADLLPDLEPETLWRVVDARWHELTFDAEWLSEQERARARKMVEGLSAYLTTLRDQNVDVIAVECEFNFPVGGGRLVGRVDRVQRLADGTVVIVDLKTGAVSKSAGDAAENAQLACYQFALVSDQVVRDSAGGGGKTPVVTGVNSGGAELIYVNPKATNDAKSGYLIRSQAGLAREGAARDAVEARIEAAIEGMSGSSFRAVLFTREERGDIDSHYTKRIHTVRAVSA